MEQYLKILANLRTEIEQMGDVHEFFGTVYNAATLTLELGSYYYQVWGRAEVVARIDNPEQSKEENAKRLIHVSMSSLFVTTMSMLEFHVRQTIISKGAEHPLSDLVNRREKFVAAFDCVHDALDEDAKKPWKGFRRQVKEIPPFDSFGPIQQQSMELGLLCQVDATLLKFATEARNVTVHNNTIGRDNRSITLEGDTAPLEIREGRQMHGSILGFPLLTTQIVRAAGRWLPALEKASA